MGERNSSPQGLRSIFEIMVFTRAFRIKLRDQRDDGRRRRSGSGLSRSAQAIKAALAYYEQNKEYIDARLLLNSA